MRVFIKVSLAISLALSLFFVLAVYMVFFSYVVDFQRVVLVGIDAIRHVIREFGFFPFMLKIVVQTLMLSFATFTCSTLSFYIFEKKIKGVAHKSKAVNRARGI